MVKAPTLAYPDFTRPFELHTDASTQGLGAVLVQRKPDGTRHAIRYLSRTLKPAEKHYNVAELECLAIVWATSKLRPYIEGKHFTVYTDHYGLKWLKSKKPDDMPSKVHRWSVGLSRFKFDVVYKKGEKNIADYISRHPVEEGG